MATPIVQKDVPHQDYTAADEALFGKVSWHLLPLLIIAYGIAFLDRINIGFAQLQMKNTLAFSEEAFAFGASIFFVGYFLFEVPSNLLLEKIGARKTLLRIMFCWGLTAAAMGYVNSHAMFYVLRFLLGVFEAGFFPGIILYLTYWYPAARRGKIICIFMTATSIAYLIAGPLSGAIMKYMDGWLGHYGWQWLFIVQGLPASIIGVLCYFYLKDKPEQADWLTPAEKVALRKHLDNDAHTVQTASHGSLWSLLRDPKIFVMSFVYFLFLGAVYVIVFYAPTLVRSWGIKDLFTIGLLTSIGPLFGIFGSVLIGRSSDKHLERRKHFFFTQLLAAGGIAFAAYTMGSVTLGVIGLTIMSIGTASMTPIFFTAVSEYLPAKTAAGGIALISSLGNLGPAAMPPIMAWINTRTGAPVTSFYIMSAIWIVAGLILMAAVKPALAGKPKLAPA